MKCELCHEGDAAAVLHKKIDGADRELYVCKKCAAKENARSKPPHAHPAAKLPPGMSLTIQSADGREPPPMVIDAVLNATMEMMSKIVNKAAEPQAENKPRNPDATKVAPLSGVSRDVALGPYMQLEGIFLIGEINPVLTALEALGIEADSIEACGIKAAGHFYTFRHNRDPKSIQRIMIQLYQQEMNARWRLMHELPRVLGDSLNRALAVLQNARLLSAGEIVDLLSPIRLACSLGFADNISLEETDQMIVSQPVDEPEESNIDRRDKADGRRADALNRRFREVRLSKRAKEFLP